MKALFTLGYQGADIDGFLAALRRHHVGRVIDVRAVARSRKSDFAKARLGEHLTRAGVDYRHLPALGTPRAGRAAAAAGDIAGHFRILNAALDGAEGQAALLEAAGLAAERPSCLICLEADPARCHRSVVAARLAALRDFEVRHLHLAEVAPTAR